MNKVFDNLLEINRNKNGDYYFIYEVPNVRNLVNTKGKPRNEVLIVGVPKDKLRSYLKSSFEQNNIYPEENNNG